MFVYPATHFLAKYDCFKSRNKTSKKKILLNLIAFHSLHVTQETREIPEE